ncbi:MAG: HEPN domain-containing protein [Candidatus Odinarchaeota archaeon]
MEKKRNLMEIAFNLLSKAEQKVKSSKILLEHDLIDDSVSRAYYAAFLAAKAALLILGEDPKTHQGTLTLFGLKLVKKGLLPEILGRYLSDLLEKRQAADYAVINYLSKEDGQELIVKAEKIIQEITKFLNSNFKK